MLLFLNRGGITRTVAIVPPKYDDANIGPQLTLLRCNTKIIHNKYLYYFIQGENFKKQVISSDAGTALQFFGIEKTKKFKITLPEIREQQKIVSVLNSIDNLLSSYDKTIQTTQKLKKGLMQKLLTKGIDHKKFKKVPWLFGKEIEIPEEWEIKKIEDLFKLKSGSTPSRKIPEYFAGNIPWITSTDLNRSKITSTLEKITPEAVKQTNLKLLPKGTFLIATYGLEAAGTRGKCGITKMESTCNQACMAFLPSSEITSEFLFYFYLYFGEKSFSVLHKEQNNKISIRILSKKFPCLFPHKKNKREL